jgi:hypothetical protein
MQLEKEKEKTDAAQFPMCRIISHSLLLSPAAKTTATRVKGKHSNELENSKENRTTVDRELV